uniref:Uncharacterized protein n=1 Tax=Moniliophthora roreri TaxID=221103 RepID=A0A0W0FIZ7_MONRR
MQSWRSISILSILLFLFTFASALPNPGALDLNARSPEPVPEIVPVNVEARGYQQNVYDIIVQAQVQITAEVEAIKRYDALTYSQCQHHIQNIRKHVSNIHETLHANVEAGVEVDVIFGGHTVAEINVVLVAVVNIIVDLINYCTKLGLSVYASILVDLIVDIHVFLQFYQVPVSLRTPDMRFSLSQALALLLLSTSVYSVSIAARSEGIEDRDADNYKPPKYPPKDPHYPSKPPQYPPKPSQYPPKPPQYPPKPPHYPGPPKHYARGEEVTDFGKGYGGKDHDGKDHDGKDHDGKDHDGKDHDGKDHSGKDHDGKGHGGKDYDGKGYGHTDIAQGGGKGGYNHGGGYGGGYGGDKDHESQDWYGGKPNDYGYGHNGGYGGHYGW